MSSNGSASNGSASNGSASNGSAMSAQPRREAFIELAKAGATVIPVQRVLVADGLTPVLARVTLAAAFPGEPTFLLESVVGGETWARYSFVGLGASCVVRGGGDRFVTCRPDPDKEPEVETGVDPYQRLGEILRSWQPPPAEALASLGLPRFWGGAVGYLAYDAVHRFEPTVLTGRSTAESTSESDSEITAPDELAFSFGSTLVVFDGLHQTLRILVPARVAEEDRDVTERAGAAYELALGRIESVAKALATPQPLPWLPVPSADVEGELPASSFTRPAFEAAVRRVQQHILEGDAFQVVLSQRFMVDARDIDPFALYRALRVVNPSPYMFFVELPGVTVAGASPETLVHIESGFATVCPIAGTRRRGRDAQEDEARARELLADPKERAEHVMLVDLGRNDLGRIAKPGTVRILERMGIELFSHVMHMTSRITAEIGDGLDTLDVLRAVFPAGTLSGAPKVRAMQIIEDLEPVPRGLYGGAVGYIGFDGNADLAIAIRTITTDGTTAVLQAGAGIVEASDPASEYRETVNKARAGLVALEAAARVGR